MLASSNNGNIPKGGHINALDIGCGANCIYPLLGARSYHWSFVGADIDAVAVKTAQLLVASNKNVSKKITIKKQQSSLSFFNHIIQPKDKFAFTMCNPPFHHSMEAASEGSRLKQQNLNKKSVNNFKQSPNDKTPLKLNFSGQQHELSCEGGELEFVKRMVIESKLFQNQVCWFTCLLSKGENVKPITQLLAKQKVLNVKVIEISQGHKISRFIAWSYMNNANQSAFFIA